MRLLNEQCDAQSLDEIWNSAAIADQFIAALDAADHQRWPYDYWLLEEALEKAVAESVALLPFAVQDGMDFGGRRECNNALRVYFTPGLQQRITLWGTIADAFKDARLIRRIEQLTSTDLSNSRLRIEYCQDTDGFWLEPHRDISVKLFSMSIYLSDAPELAEAGTDIYDDSPDHRWVARAPYGKGKAMIFIPGVASWHGFSKRPIQGVRKSLIVNYVTADWRAQEELA
jgi:hypothetical protein